MPNDIVTRSIAVLGGPNTGKSHYAIQLFGRLRGGENAIELRKVPESTSLFQAGLERLNQGLAAIHTSTDTYLECTLPLRFGSQEIDVQWPDYDGEQLHKLVMDRQINHKWQSRIASAHAWLLFIRLAIMPQHKDIFTFPIETELLTAHDTNNSGDHIVANAAELTEQAKVVELLQILLHAAHVDISRPTQNPILGVVISCWDEVCSESNVAPSSLLSDKAPLISQFIHSNWHEDSRFIIGLSSTGKPLDQNAPDKDFRDKGPEEFGFAIDSSGKRIDDLTLPISKLFELTKTNGC